MKEDICIDSQIFVWGVKEIASEGQENMIDRTKRFLEWLDENKARIILPAPIITEVLSPVSSEDDRRKFMDVIYQRFRIAPVDDIAAQIGAAIWNKHKDYKQFYDVDGPGLKNRFKYDLLIVSVAMAQGVTTLYSEDKGLRNLANANGLKAVPIPNIPKQQSLFGEAKDAEDVEEDTRK